MAERLAGKIRQIAELQTGNPVSGQFLERLETDPRLTRDENPQTHYCV